jgi:succinate dehydrogenase/fumarate reductase flavoprotein subunit
MRQTAALYASSPAVVVGANHDGLDEAGRCGAGMVHGALSSFTNECSRRGHLTGKYPVKSAEAVEKTDERDLLVSLVDHGTY